MAPEISAHLLWMNIRRQGQLSPIFQSAREEIRILHRRREHAWLAVHKRHVCVLHALADAPPREENRHRMTRRVDAGIREDVGAVVRLVRAVHDEIEFAISIEIHRQRKRPQPTPRSTVSPGLLYFSRSNPSARTPCTEDVASSTISANDAASPWLRRPRRSHQKRRLELCGQGGQARAHPCRTHHFGSWFSWRKIGM